MKLILTKVKQGVQTFSSIIKRIFTFKPIAELTQKNIEKILSELTLSGGTRIDQGVLEVLALDESKAIDMQDGLIFLLTDGVNERGAESALSVMQSFVEKRGVLPKIIALGIGNKYDASYVVELLNKSPWMHIKNLDTAALVNEKDKIVHQLQGEWVSLDLIIKSLNKQISIPIGSIDITERFSITLTSDDLMAGDFLDRVAVDALFNATKVTIGIARCHPLTIEHKISFFNPSLIPYFESATAGFEQQSIVGSLSLSDKNRALALFRMIPWTSKQGFEKIQARQWNVSREHAIDIQHAELGCEPNNDPNYNRLRLRLKKIIEGKQLSKEIGARLISDSSASASHTAFRGNRNAGQERQLIDPFSLQDFAEIDEEQGTIQKPYLFLVINNETGSIQLHPCRYEKKTILALKDNTEKNYTYTKFLLPPGPYEQGIKNKSSIVLFIEDKLLTDYLKTGADYTQALIDINPVNLPADFQHIFVCSTSTKGFSEETLLRAKKFMQNLVRNSGSRVNFSLISYNASSKIIFEKKSVEQQEDRELMLKDIENLALFTEETEQPSPSLGLARSLSLWADSINPIGDEKNYYPPTTKIYLFMGECNKNEYGDYDFYDDYDVLKSKYKGRDNSCTEDDPDCLNIDKFNLLLHSGDEVMLPYYRVREVIKYFLNKDTPSDKVPSFTIFTEHDSFPHFIKRFLVSYTDNFGAGIVEKQPLPVAEREETKGNGSNRAFFGSHVQALELSEPSEVASDANYSP